jgi:hypothetical protein
MLDPIQYEFRFFQNTLADPEPGAGAETSIFQLRLRPKVSAPAGSGSATLSSMQYNAVDAIRVPLKNFKF